MLPFRCSLLIAGRYAMDDSFVGPVPAFILNDETDVIFDELFDSSAR